MRSKVLLILLACVIAGVASAQESEDEARAGRAEYELMRLNDPSTRSIPENIRTRELQFASRFTKSATAFKNSSVQSIDWASRGPSNIGARTRALGIDVANENIILAGGTTGGMWRSTDRGLSWVRTTPLSVLPSTSSLAQDTRSGKTNTWYYGTGEFGNNTGAYPTNGTEGHSRYGEYFGNGIFKSTDNGVTWNVLPSTSSDTIGSLIQPFNFVRRIVTDRSNDSEDVLYAAIPGGIERSSDGGATWTLVLGDFPEGLAKTDVGITSTGVVYAAIPSNLIWKPLFGDSIEPATSSNGGIYRSTDGIHWTNLTPLGWSRSLFRSLVAIAPSNENAVYFAFDSILSLGTGQAPIQMAGCLWKYTYRSGDGAGTGGTFEDRSDGMPSVTCLSVKPDDENLLFYGGVNLQRSADGFATALFVTPLRVPHVDVKAIAYFPSNPSAMIVGCDGGLFLTENSLAPFVQWSNLNNGYVTTQFYTAAIEHSARGDSTIIGGLQDNGTWVTSSSLATIPWAYVGGGDGATCAIADGGTSYYISSQWGETVRETLDDTGNIIDQTRIDPIGSAKYAFINPFCLDPANTSRMYFSGGSFLWRNDDVTAIPAGGYAPTSVGWIKLARTTLLPIDSIIHTPMISAITSTRTASNRVYYGTTDGRLYRLDSANATDPSPKPIWEGKGFPKLAYVSSVATDSKHADNAIVAFANYNVQSLYYTSDGGSTWTPIGGNLEEHADGTGSGPSVRSVAMMHSGNGMIYLVGTSTGLYSTSTLSGMSTVWTLEGPTTIGNNIVNAIDTRESDGMIAVATCGHGMFSGQFAPAASVAPDAPTASSVIDISPNPTNGIVTIYGTSSAEKLTVTTVLGESLSNIERLNGSQRVLDLTGVPCGSYFLRISNAGVVTTKTIIKE